MGPASSSGSVRVLRSRILRLGENRLYALDVAQKKGAGEASPPLWRSIVFPPSFGREGRALEKDRKHHDGKGR